MIRGLLNRSSIPSRLPRLGIDDDLPTYDRTPAQAPEALWDTKAEQGECASVKPSGTIVGNLQRPARRYGALRHLKCVVTFAVMIGSGKVVRCRLPIGSQLHVRAVSGDFQDCYRVASALTPRHAAEIIVDFPGWTRILLAIRRLLTEPFGLSNDGPEAADKIGPFPVEFETPDELIAGFDDRHLDFRISVLSEAGFIHLATWVHCHNPGGRAYLAAILPFHIQIARNALARVGVKSVVQHS